MTSLRAACLLLSACVGGASDGVPTTEPPAVPDGGAAVVDAGTMAGPPSFVVVIADDMRYDAWGGYLVEAGSSHRFYPFRANTPNLDALAAEPRAVRFLDANVVMSVCSPSRAAMLTGKYNHLNSVAGVSQPFDVHQVTYATLLRDAGYATGYFGKWHMGNQVERPGFDEYASFIGSADYYQETFLVREEGQPDREAASGPRWTDAFTTDFALDFIERHADEPFLAVVGMKAPHAPYTPDQVDEELFAGVVVPDPPNVAAMPPYPTDTDHLGPEKVRNYFRSLHGMDRQLGRILEKLESLGIAEHTMVVFVSDNGYLLNEHGQNGKRNAYEASIRVPMIIRYPALGPVAASQQSAPVLNIDLAPTIVDAAGLRVPKKMQGRSLLPLLREGAVSGWRDGFLYEHFHEEGTPDAAVPHIVAYRGPVNKIVTYPDHPNWVELFATADDPFETTNLAGSSAPLLQSMHDELAAAEIDVDYVVPTYADPNL